MAERECKPFVEGEKIFVEVPVPAPDDGTGGERALQALRDLTALCLARAKPLKLAELSA